MTEMFIGFVFAWSVIDGDTIRVNAHVWPNITVIEERVRLLGVDTPELRAKTECERLLAQDARQFILKMLTEGKNIKVHIPLGTPGQMRDSFGRLLAHVTVNGQDIGTELINQRLARPFGTKGVWC